MKKKTTIVVAVMCALLLMLTSCSSQNPRDRSAAFTHNSNESNHVGGGEQEDALAAERIDYRFKTNDYSRYKEHIDKSELPDGFITYENGIDLLGSFTYYRENEEDKKMNGNLYYGVTDANGYSIDIYLKKEPTDYDSLNYSQINAPTDTTDVRKSETQRAYFVYENITYVYDIYGGLMKIIWETNGYYCSVWCKGMDEYPLSDKGFWNQLFGGSKPTFIERLLDLDTAPDAVAEFNAAAAK